LPPIVAGLWPRDGIGPGGILYPAGHRLQEQQSRPDKHSQSFSGHLKTPFVLTFILCPKAGQIDFEFLILADHLVPHHFCVPSCRFSSKNCRQRGVDARLNRRIVIDSVYNTVMKSVQVPPDAIDIEVRYFPAPVTSFISSY